MTTDANASLPRNWTCAELGQIADVQLGKMLDKKRTEGTPLRYLRNINVRWGGIDTSDLLEMPFKEREQDRYSLLPGDVLVCEGGEPGRAAVWQTDDPTIKYQKALHRVRMRGEILPHWLVFHLYFDAQRGALTKHFTGTTIKHFPREAFREYPLRVAPMPEQARIVEAIESYFTRLDDAVATLERVQRNLKRYRASVLKAAVEGRLVPTEAELARAEDRNYEPASVLLERLLAERRRRWEEAELAKMQAKGKTPKDDKWKAKYREPLTTNAADLPRLPEGWRWATVDALSWDGGYGTSRKCQADASGPPVLRIPNVQDETLTFDDLKFATGEDDLPPDGVLMPGDFVFIRTNGSKSLIGRGALVTSPMPRDYFFASYLIRLRLAASSTTAKWFALAWHVPVVRDQLLRDAASSAGQHNVSLTAARSYLVPLPPLAEQERVLAEVERLLSIGDSARSIVRPSIPRAASLRQSILKWAFEGRIVDQDPTDEPASRLLERIQAERESADGQPRRSPRRPRAGSPQS